MSFENGWAALNLEFPEKLPRTEYSVQYYHWELLKTVTGIDTAIPENRRAATRLFLEKWDFAMNWRTLVSTPDLEAAGIPVTKLGHAEFAGDGADYDAAVQFAFEDPDEAVKLDPATFRTLDEKELIARFESSWQEGVEECGQLVNMSGTYVTLFSGLIAIYGIEMLLLLLGLYPEETGEIAAKYSRWIRQYFRAFAASRVPVMMVHDDLCWTSGPVTSPEWYRKHIFPHLKGNIEIVKSAGKKVYFTSDGTIDEFFDDIADLGVDAVVMEPTSDIREFARRHGKTCGMVGGVDCRTLTYGSRAEIEEEVTSIIEFGKKFPGFMLAVGNHLPANVPVERCLFYNELYEKHAWR